jgi:GH35 family endo-1,4-beta-xylanase
LLSAGTGLRADYFNGTNLANLALTRTDAAVDFDWGSGSPDPRVSAGNFSGRWSGQVQASYTETFTFTTRSSDGVRLWIDGQLLIDDWTDHAATEDSGSLNLIAGRRYDLLMEYYAHTGTARASLQWASPSQARQVIPSSQLFPSERGGILREVWTGIPGTQVSDLTSSPDYPDRPSSGQILTNLEAPANAGVNYGQRLRGLVYPPQTGLYTFWIASQDQAQLYLSNSADPTGQRLIASVPDQTDPRQWDKYPQQRSAAIALVAGQAYYIEALHKQGTDSDNLAVAWTLPDSRFEGPIPGYEIAPVLPTVRLYASQPYASEGSGASATLTAVRDGGSPATPVTVRYTVGGTAVSGIQFQALSGSVTIPAGATSASITVTPIDDGHADPRLTVLLTLADQPGSYVLGPESSRTATAYIDDGNPVSTAGRINLLPADFLNRFWGPDPTYGSKQIVDVSGPGFTQAVQVTTTRRPANIWDFQTGQANVASVARSETLFLQFYARSAGSGPASLQVVVEKAGPPYGKSLFYLGSVGTDWTKFQLPFAAIEPYAVGGANLGLQLGFDPQIIQFGGITLTDYGLPSSLLPAEVLGSFRQLGNFGSSRVVTTTGPGFTQALEVTTTSRPANVYDFQFIQPNVIPFAQNDALYLQFYARSTGSGPASLQVVVEKAGNPYTKSLFYNNTVGPGWTLFKLPFTAAESYATGGANLGLQLGYDPQTIQFGGITLVDASISPSVLPADLLGRFQGPDPTYGSKQIVDVNGPGFTQAVQVTTTSRPANVWDFQINQPDILAVGQNDKMFLQFYARSTGSGSASFRVVFEKAGSPYTQSLLYDGTVGASWTKIQLPFPMVEAYAAGGAQFGIQLGFDPQTIQVGGILLTDASAAVSVNDLPRTVPPANYGGRPGDAAWRTAANTRIAQQRMANLAVTVHDASGQVLDGAAVFVRQKRHAFQFGSALAGSRLVRDNSPDSVIYRAVAQQLFNTATIENDLKWSGWESNRQLGIDAATWVVNAGMNLRGHNLVWPSRTFMPARVWNTYDSIYSSQGPTAAAAWLRQEILNHITDEAGTLAGLPAQWDVVNEPFANHAAMDVLGNAAMVDWYTAARNADPNAKLYLNDYGIFTNTPTAHQDNFAGWIQYLLSNGAPLDGIGEQSHLSGDSLPDIDRLQPVIDRFAAFGVPIEITEFDVDTTDLQLQADYLRDYMTFMFSQPSVGGFVMWGFWQGSHWRPDAALFRSDWSIKPNGQQYEDLLFGDWWTDTRGTTANGGPYTTRAFLGDYDIVVQLGGQTQTVQATLGPGGLSLDITLPGGGGAGGGGSDSHSSPPPSGAWGDGNGSDADNLTGWYLSVSEVASSPQNDLIGAGTEEAAYLPSDRVNGFSSSINAILGSFTSNSGESETHHWLSKRSALDESDDLFGDFPMPRKI